MRGSWTLIANTDKTAWTQGFYPGSLWTLYAQTGDAKWKDLATRWTTPLDVQQTNTATHDLGFKLFPAFGAGFQLTKDDADRQTLLTAARSLATRFRPQAGIICMGDWNTAWKMPIVNDTMMNIELLMWAARNGGDPAWEQMAVSHALVSMRDLIRPDGSTYHVADYDPASGKLRWHGTFQGYSDSSTWTRGQVWVMYGMTKMYSYTHRPEFLDAARRTSDYFLSRLPPDSVPPWDFDAPNPLKDSSAGSAAAAALLDLAAVETDQANATRYRATAEKILDTLAGPEYLAENSSSQGVLLHGVGHFPDHEEIDVSLVYGDYYFLQAIVKALHAAPAPAQNAGAAAPPSEGTTADAGAPSPASGGVIPGEPTATGTTQNGPGGCDAVGGTSALSALGLVIAARPWKRRRSRMAPRHMSM